MYIPKKDLSILTNPVDEGKPMPYAIIPFQDEEMCLAILEDMS